MHRWWTKGHWPTVRQPPATSGSLRSIAILSPAVAGAKVQTDLAATAGAGNPDTYLHLESPTRKVFEDDDGSGTLNARLITVLPESGTYVLYATTFRSAGTGNYSVTLTCASGNGTRATGLM